MDRANWTAQTLRPTQMLRRAVGVAGVLAAILTVVAAFAQQPGELNVNAARRAFKEANCAYCHGWSGNGQGDPFSPGKAANLRETKLAREQIIEVVQCGRPATEMPHFDEFAYTDKRCYGLIGEELGGDKPKPSAFPQRRREIELIVDYVLAKITNRGLITLAECEEFYSPNSIACVPYR